jgi:hypothetical protein
MKQTKGVLKLQLILLSGLLILTSHVLPVTKPSISTILTSSMKSSALQDTVRPEITAWGIEGRASQGEAFIVWANVTDYQSGLRNVSLVVNADNGTLTRTYIYQMESNGTQHLVQHPGLAVNHTYLLRVLAFDMANNSAISYGRTISRYPGGGTTIDPNATMPVVVASSLGFFVLVSVLAYLYDKRRQKVQQNAGSSESE